MDHSPPQVSKPPPVALPAARHPAFVGWRPSFFMTWPQPNMHLG